MQANPYQSRKLREKKKKQKKLRLIIFLVVTISILVFFVYVLNASYFRVQRIVVNELEYANREEVELATKNQLDGRFFGLFAKSNIFILPRGNIYKELKSNFPSIKKVDLDVKGLTEIELEIEEYVANAIWCDVPVTPATLLSHDAENQDKVSSAIPQVLTSFSGQNCFFLNDSGIVFSPTDYDNNQEVIKFFGGITSDPLRQTYANKKTFASLVEFTKLLRRLNIVSDQVWTTNGEVYAFVTKEKVKIYIDSKDNIVDVFDNLETVIKRDAINQAQFSNIDYIDLRFGNRVFYKLK